MTRRTSSIDFSQESRLSNFTFTIYYVHHLPGKTNNRNDDCHLSIIYWRLTPICQEISSTVALLGNRLKNYWRLTVIPAICIISQWKVIFITFHVVALYSQLKAFLQNSWLDSVEINIRFFNFAKFSSKLLSSKFHETENCNNDEDFLA